MCTICTFKSLLAVHVQPSTGTKSSSFLDVQPSRFETRQKRGNNEIITWDNTRTTCRLQQSRLLKWTELRTPRFSSSNPPPGSSAWPRPQPRSSNSQSTSALHPLSRLHPNCRCWQTTSKLTWKVGWQLWTWSTRPGSRHMKLFREISGTLGNVRIRY